MDLKSRISTPLEAGTSILDVHRLPTYLVPALEYTSRRLAEKGLHATLVVARRDYQLPGCSKESKPTHSVVNMLAALPTPPCSPDSPANVACGSATIRPLVRSQSQQAFRGEDRQDFARPRRTKTGTLSKKSSLASLFDGSLGSPRLRWTPTSNVGPFSPKMPRTPVTPLSCVTTTSPASSVAGGSLGAQGPDIRLIYTTSLAPRAYKLVTATLARASRKYNLSSTLTAHEPSAYNIPTMVLHSSILQNEILHSSEGITLLALDNLYTFKTALSHYAAIRTEAGSHFALEDAVDELRRYVLSSTAGRRKLLKSSLLQAFEWLGPVNETALAEVTVMYSRAYGTATDTGVVDDLVVITSSPADAVSKTLGETVDEAVEIRKSETTPKPPADQTLCADESMIDVAYINAVLDRDIPDAPVEEHCSTTNEANGGDETPVPTKDISQTQVTPTNTPVMMPQSLPAPPLSPRQMPSPKTSLRPSAPALKLQTSFPSIHKPTPKRKKTPVPSPSKRHSRTSKALSDAPPMPIFLSASPPSPITIDGEAHVELTVSPIDDDTASLQTDFEDAELTARSPAVAPTPGGSIWLGIDDILSGGGLYGSKRRSSDMSLQTPAGEKMGPMTPNGYEDISPVTRGEWGFLMVEESFRTRTAGVSCV